MYCSCTAIWFFTVYLVKFPVCKALRVRGSAVKMSIVWSISRKYGVCYGLSERKKVGEIGCVSPGA